MDRERWGLQSVVAIVLVLVLLAGIGYPLFRHFTIKGLQAEAFLMLSYLNTLESAYAIEHGQVIGFEEYYGAPMEGRDNCQQPEGAQKLGFMVRWCHKQGAAPVRYAYRVIAKPGSKNFSAEAISGSDELKQSFICFGDNETDLWQLSDNKELKRVRACE